MNKQQEALQIVMSVYFNGTDDSDSVPDEGPITLASLLDHLTKTDDSNVSICEDGCGVGNHDPRDSGIIFTYNLEKQVKRVAKQVEAFVRASGKVILNVYGFSRGGVSAFLLCQKLKHIAKDRLTINVASFEPVPGNFIMVAQGDIFFRTNRTLSAAVADLSDCQNIANMLILFTNQPLPDIACHAPILPALPSSCNTVIDVTPGCHKGAVAFSKSHRSASAMNNQSAIIFHRIAEFMQQNGTVFDFNRLWLDKSLVSPTQLVLQYNQLARLFLNDHGMKRSMHLSNTIFTATSEKKYLNRYHQKLLCVENAKDEDCILTLATFTTQSMNPNHTKVMRFLQLAFMLSILLMIYKKFISYPALEINDQTLPLTKF